MDARHKAGHDEQLESPTLRRFRDPHRCLTHIFPPAYFARLQSVASAAGPLKRWMELTSLYDLDQRFRLMDAFEDYRQILTPSMPPIEDLAEGEAAVDLMRLMNDGLAELVGKFPDRFPAFAGALSLLDPDAAVAEVESGPQHSVRSAFRSAPMCAVTRWTSRASCGVRCHRGA